MSSDKDQNIDIPEMNLDPKYSNKKPIVPENSEKMQKEMEKNIGITSILLL